MPRRNLLPHFSRIRTLRLEIDEFVPTGHTRTVAFRADLAGLLVVLIAATYESCVKESIGTFASSCHKSFGEYADRSYSKISSRISISDLYKYVRLFDSAAHTRFKLTLKSRQNQFESKFGVSIKDSYAQMLSWRHDFAHGGVRNTTVEEAFETHQRAKHVLYCFEEALNGP